MIQRRLATALLLLSTGWLSSCATNTTAVRAAQYGALPSFAEAGAKLSDPAAGSLRLFIYRPEALVGMWGRAIVIVNGKALGDPARPVIDNMLIPGAVFVVDVPKGQARVTWSQPGRAEGTDAALDLKATDQRIRYLRWTLRTTHGVLEPVSLEQGSRDVSGLKFSGYVVVDG